MFITSTSALLRMTTSSAAAITVQASWVDHTVTGGTAMSDNTAIASATTTTIVGSPASATQRQVTRLFIANTDSISCICTIEEYDGATAARSYKVTLLSGESCAYDGNKWSSYNAAGVKLIFTGISAAGADTQIQFNSGGSAVGASADFTFNDTTKQLALNGTNTSMMFKNVTSNPSAPVSGDTLLYSKAICGKSAFKQVDASGIDYPLQGAIWQSNIVTFTPQVAAGLWSGTSGSNLGTPAIALPTVTNIGTMMRSSLFPSVVITANQQVGTRSEAMFFRGNATGIGGFFFACRFMFSTWTAGNRLFVGMCAGTTAVVTVQPSTLTNMLGFGIDAGDTAITFMHNDAAGTCTKDPIAGQPALATNNAYAAYIFCKPNDSTVYYRLDDLNAGTTIIDTSTNTDLPVNTTGLCAQAIMGNAANVVAGNATIGVNKIYIETDV